MANKRVNKILRLKDISGLVKFTNDNDLVDFVMIEYPKCLANSIIYKENDYVELINPFPKQALVFTCLQDKSFENTVGKGEIARNEQFLLFPQCFLPVWRAFCHFQQI